MRTRSKLIIAAIAATALLGVAVSTAAATRLEIPNSERGFRLTWSSLTLEAAGIVIACPVTLEGSFVARTFAKRDGANIGRVTRAAANTRGCTQGHFTILTANLPWDVNYHAFEGTLPAITGLTTDIIGMEFQVESGITCLARTEGNEPFRGIANVSSGRITEFRSDTSATIGTSGGFLCRLGSRGHYAGTATATVLGESAQSQLVLVNEVRLTPSPVEFGRVEPEELARRTVTITAVEATTINRISVRTGNYFAITDPNRCVGSRLAERATCSFRAIFVAPGEAGRTLEDTISVEATEGGTATDVVRGST